MADQRLDYNTQLKNKPNILALPIDYVTGLTNKPAIPVLPIDYVTNIINKPTALGLVSTDFNFTPQTPGGSLVIGSNTIIMNPMPSGINATSILQHKLYISGGVGAAEAVLITGWTSSTVTVTCTGTHSGAWTIKSATVGLQEAIRSVSVANGLSAAPRIDVPYGAYTMQSKVYIDNYASIFGSGSNSTIFLKAFGNDDLFYLGDNLATLSGIAGILKDFQIRITPGIIDTSGFAVHVNYRFGVTIENVSIYGDPNPGIGQVNNAFKFDSSIVFAIKNCKAKNLLGYGLELATTGANQTAGQIELVELTTTSTTVSLVYFHGNILSLNIRGLQLQGGFVNWEIDTTGGAFTESTISGIVFDGAISKAFNLHGTGNTFKIAISGIILATANQPNTYGMVFDGTGAGTFQDIEVNNINGGVNASNHIGTAFLLIGVNNFILNGVQLQGAGAGAGDTTLQIQGNTNCVTISNSTLGKSDSGINSGGTVTDRGVYVPSGTHSCMKFIGNTIHGITSGWTVAGVHTNLMVIGNSFESAGTPSAFSGSGTKLFRSNIGLADS